MTPQEFDGETQRLIRERQRGRSRVTGLLLGALVVLFFAIAIVKIAARAG